MEIVEKPFISFQEAPLPSGHFTGEEPSLSIQSHVYHSVEE